MRGSRRVDIVRIVGCLMVATMMAGCARARFGPPIPGKVLGTPRTLKQLTVEERLAILRRAEIWHPINTASLDLLNGPAGRDAVPFNGTVTCEYVYPERPLSGATPKLHCRLGPDDVVKVKYGRKNREMYAEAAAARLLWATGFATDRWYPVRVICENCPANPWAASQAEWFKGRPHLVTRRVLDPASLEREFEGTPIETPDFKGWAWPELDQVDVRAGGASRAEVDALKLMAVFLQHTDSKPSQQDLVCLPGHIVRDEAGNETCTAAQLVLTDIGTTFGKPTRLNISKMDLGAWRSNPIWLDGAPCVGNLRRLSTTATLENPKIGEAGRRLLAERLALLSDRQIRDLFLAARAERYGGTFRDRSGQKRQATVDDWVSVFKAKRTEIANHRCSAAV